MGSLGTWRSVFPPGLSLPSFVLWSPGLLRSVLLTPSSTPSTLSRPPSPARQPPGQLTWRIQLGIFHLLWGGEFESMAWGLFGERLPISQGAGGVKGKQLLEDDRLAWAPDASPECVNTPGGDTGIAAS